MLPFLDPSIKWYIKPALNHLKVGRGTIVDPATNTTITDNGVTYSCDDAICFPRHFAGRMKWYDPSTGNVGGNMFDKEEAWDHGKRESPSLTHPQRTGLAALVPGYGGYFLAIPLTDGTNVVQVNIIRRYIDDTILIFNTGKYAGTTYSMNIIVYDPPSGLGYYIATNGTLGTGQTTLAPGQYVIFYKSSPAPSVDTANGVFQTSPLGTNKSLANELWVNSFTMFNKIRIPKMYLGVRTPTDIEVISNGAYPGVNSINLASGTSGEYNYPLVARGGADTVYSTDFNVTYNTSRIVNGFNPTSLLCKGDVLAYAWDGGNMVFGAWFGWGENDVGDVKYIILSQFSISVDSSYEEMLRLYDAYIYDIDRDEAYAVHIIRPLTNFTSHVCKYTPAFSFVGIDPDATALGYMYYTDAWDKKTIAVSEDEYIGYSYGFCNFYTDKIICAEGLGVYTTDPDITISNPKAAFGYYRPANKMGGIFIRVPLFEAVTLKEGHIYVVVTRLKNFSATATDADLQNWFKSLPPKALTADDYNGILRMLPGSLWMFGRTKQDIEEASITAPTSARAGDQITVGVSATTRTNTPVWVALVDQNGNVLANTSGTTDASGNASLTLTVPSTAQGRHKILTVIKGTRQLI